VKHDDAELNDARLRDLAQRLGTRAAEQLDVDRTTEAVLLRLRGASRGARRWRIGIAPAWLRIAAVVVALVGAGLAIRRDVLRRPRGVPFVEPATSELNDLSPDQLRAVLDVVEQPAGGSVAVSTQEAGLEELTAPQLRALLASLEG
jgi:hypothetical protein